MPDPLTYVFVGFLAAGTGYMTLLARFDPLTRTLTGATSAVVWSIWAFNSRAIIFDNGNSAAVIEEYRSLFFVGLGLALVMIVFTSRIALETLDELDIDLNI